MVKTQKYQIAAACGVFLRFLFKGGFNHKKPWTLAKEFRAPTFHPKKSDYG